MAIAKLQDAGLSSPRYRRSVPDGVPPSRPSDWLALPTVAVGQQTLVGLYAVFNHGSNLVAFTISGAYTVDWGDGSAAENFAAGVQANHTYSYSSLSSATLTSVGYRQAIITITMQSGQTLTAANLNLKAPGVVTNNSCSGWLDIRMAGSAVNSLAIGAEFVNVWHAMLQQFEYVGASAITSCYYLFAGCRALRTVIGTSWTSASTNFTRMFDNCGSLQAIPILDTANGTQFVSMFRNCSSLRSVPPLNTAAGTSFAGMFINCASLQTVPMFNTAAGASFGLTFQGCSSLRTVPLLNTGAGKDFDSMFAGCTALRTIPLLNTASGTDFSWMFQNCSTLETIPLLNTGAGLTFVSMFESCSSLVYVPLLNTAAGTDFSSMFYFCSSLQVAPFLNTAAGGTAFTNIFGGAYALASGALNGTTGSISYANCNLSGAELDRIYTNLASVAGQTITVTGNWGTASDTPSIATAKGWTVVGS